MRMDGVRHVVAVASGKGGVGKSTIAANLAAAAAARGVRVGLLDLDIYGPSVPTLMGLEGADPALNKEGRLVPPVAHGVKAMSMGFMVPADRAMIWRGPIIMSAVQQLLRDVDWGELDILFLDLPPGTGDVQLTLVQRLAMDGAIIVSTPQKLALADVRRGVRMFRDTAVPILGVIENMSAITDPVTGQRFAPFGEGGARDAARELEAPFLGSLAMTPALAEASDLGIPVASDATSALGVWFAETVEAIMAMLQQNTPPQPPTIRFVN